MNLNFGEFVTAFANEPNIDTDAQHPIKGMNLGNDLNDMKLYSSS